jgi:hypothetical protein
MAFNIGPRVSFDKMQDRKGMCEKAGKANIAKEEGGNRFFRNVCTGLPNYTSQNHIN